MVDGDRLDIDLRLDAQAEALVSTPSAAKWYRARDGAQQTVVAQVGRDAHLEWLPLETIVFDGARVRQSLRVELAPGASWSGWEITRFGRSARGEEFARGSWRSATEVWRTDGAPLWIDRQQLSGGSALLRDAYGLAGRAVAATFAWIGQTAPVELVDAVRARWARAAYGGEVGITRQAEGLVCRYRGDSTSAARAWFVDAWEEIRRHARGRPACPPRVWNI
jgi:urease accessory protein